MIYILKKLIMLKTNINFLILTLAYLVLVYFIIGFLALLELYSFYNVISSIDLSSGYVYLTNDALDYDLIKKAFLYALIVPGIIYLFSNNMKGHNNLYGDAKFANKKELDKKMNLFRDKGIIIGMDKSGKLLKNDPSKFIALSAPTGTNKSVSFVIPNLLEWDESIVVLDIKKENFNITSKYRKFILKQDVYIFDPFNYKTHRYNPLGYVDMEDIRERDVELAKIAATLYPTQGNGDKDIWPLAARSLFLGYVYLCHDFLTNSKAKSILELIDFTPEFTLAGILDLATNFKIQINDDEEPPLVITKIEEIIDFLSSESMISTQTKNRFNDYFRVSSKAEATSTGIWFTFTTPLKFFLETEVIKNATSTNDFDLRDLRKKKMTIYLVVTPDNLILVSLLLKLFWTQLFGLNTREEPKTNKDLKYHCLALMDEFISPGYIETYLKSVAYIRSFGLTSAIIYQNNAQIEAPIAQGGYGIHGSKALLANHGCKLYFATENKEEAEALSKMLGYQTAKDKSNSSSSDKYSLIKGSKSTSLNQRQRALMLPQEIMTMKEDEQIIRIINQKPIFCKKAIYFKSKYFVDKLKMVSPYLRSIKGLPKEEAYTHALSKHELEVPLKYLDIKTGENK